MKEVPQSFAQEPNRNKQENSFAYKKDEPEVENYGFGNTNNYNNNQHYSVPNYSLGYNNNY